MQEFHKYDLDSSGFIDPLEFTSVAMDLRINISSVIKIHTDFICILSYFCAFPLQSTDKFEFLDRELETGKEVLLIKADFTPLNTSTMTKFEKQDSVS